MRHRQEMSIFFIIIYTADSIALPVGNPLLAGADTTDGTTVGTAVEAEEAGSIIIWNHFLNIPFKS